MSNRLNKEQYLSMANDILNIVSRTNKSREVSQMTGHDVDNQIKIMENICKRWYDGGHILDYEVGVEEDGYSVFCKILPVHTVDKINYELILDKDEVYNE